MKRVKLEKDTDLGIYLDDMDEFLQIVDEKLIEFAKCFCPQKVIVNVFEASGPEQMELDFSKDRLLKVSLFKSKEGEEVLDKQIKKIASLIPEMNLAIVKELVLTQKKLSLKSQEMSSLIDNIPEEVLLTISLWLDNYRESQVEKFLAEAFFDGDIAQGTFPIKSYMFYEKQAKELVSVVRAQKER